MMVCLSTILCSCSLFMLLNSMLFEAKCQNESTLSHQEQNPNHAYRKEQQVKGTVPQPLVRWEYICPEQCICKRDKNLTILEIDCSNKNLHTIPPHLPTTTVKLLLQNNSIQNVACMDLRDLYRLEFLDLSQNLISTIRNCTFLSQSLLYHLDLFNCSITQFEAGVFHPLTRLSYLDISRNGMTEITPGLFSTLRNLTYLNLYLNSVAHVANVTFSGLESLKFLSLQRNKLLYLQGTFEPDAFKGLENLESLHIQGNHPDPRHPETTYPDMALSALPSLKELKMDGCPVTPGSGFHRLTNLTRFDLGTYMTQDLESFCSMDEIIPENFFTNFYTRQPLTVNLSACGLLKIPSKLFEPLPNIFSLDLSHNYNLRLKGFEIGSEGLTNSNLTYLNISVLEEGGREIWAVVTNTTFKFLKQTKLRSLILQHNHIIRIDPKAIFDLPRTLEYLSVRYNRIQYGSFLVALVTLSNLKVLDGSDQLIYRLQFQNQRSRKKDKTIKEEVAGDEKHLLDVTEKAEEENRIAKDHRGWANAAVGFADKAGGYEKSENEKTNTIVPDNQMVGDGATSARKGLVPTSKKSECEPNLYTDSRRIMHDDGTYPATLGTKFFHFPNKIKYPICPLPKRLEVVSMNNMKLGYPIPSAKIVGNKVLRHLEYSNNMARCWNGPILGLPSLQYLDLSKNWCMQMSLDFFEDLTNLTTLLLYENSLGQTLADDIEGKAFSTLRNLSFLDLSHNSIKDLAKTAFEHNVHLRYLNLSHNEMTQFGSVLSGVRSLEHLDLSVNTLTGLSEQNCRDFRILKTRNPNFTVNLQVNRFACSCDNIRFLSLALRHPTIFSSVTFLHCFRPNGTAIGYKDWKDLLSEMELNCQTETVFIVTLVLFCLLLGSLIVSSVYHYKRWKLTYLYYIGQKRLHVGAVPVTYQPLAKVFLTYDQDEMKWRRFLQDIFLPRLRQEGITYILGEVDFGGGHLNTHVAGAVVGTEKTLVLLSQDIFPDPDREMEINLAIMHELNLKSPVLVPVFLERVDLDLYPIDISTFLYSQDDRCLEFSDTPEFWCHLLLVLNE